MIGTALLWQNVLQEQKKQEQASLNLRNRGLSKEEFDKAFMEQLREDIASSNISLPPLKYDGSYMYPDNTVPKEWIGKKVNPLTNASMHPKYQKKSAMDLSFVTNYADKNTVTHKPKDDLNPYYTIDTLLRIKSGSDWWSGHGEYLCADSTKAWRLVSTFNQFIIPLIIFVENWGKKWLLTSTFRNGTKSDHGQGRAIDFRVVEKNPGRNYKLSNGRFLDASRETRLNAAMLYKFICSDRVPGFPREYLRQLLIETAGNTGWIHVAGKSSPNDKSSGSVYQIGYQKSTMLSIYASATVDNIKKLKPEFLRGLESLFDLSSTNPPPANNHRAIMGNLSINSRRDMLQLVINAKR